MTIQSFPGVDVWDYVLAGNFNFQGNSPAQSRVMSVFLIQRLASEAEVPQITSLYNCGEQKRVRAADCTRCQTLRSGIYNLP